MLVDRPLDTIDLDPTGSPMRSMQVRTTQLQDAAAQMDALASRSRELRLRMSDLQAVEREELATVDESARHDHAHYMMAVASARRNDINAALDHLRRAVALNPDNRSIARQDPELDSIRETPAFKAALEASAVEGAVPVARPQAGLRAAVRPKPRR